MSRFGGMIYWIFDRVGGVLTFPEARGVHKTMSRNP